MNQIGQVHVLAMSAAAAAPHAPLDQSTLDDMQSNYNVNVVGNWNLVKAVLHARMDKSKQTVIINLSTSAAYRSGPHEGVYGTSKAAFTQVMQEFSREHEEKEVRFVSYHPGAIYTEMASQHFSKDIFEGWEDVVLPGQFAVWLASPEADFLNGRFVWAEWDVNELLEIKDKVREDPFLLKISLVQ